jgi:hypothetical protein
MDTQLLKEKFERMGARVKVARDPASEDGARIDVRRDRHGEFFDVRVGRRATADAIDVRPRERHLLLAVRDVEPGTGLPRGAGQRFLCGHDERSWFVAAVPEGRGASNVDKAMDALKPAEVRQSIAQHRLPARHRNRRKTAAFKRQGEWFFVPAGRTPGPRDAILRDERLARTGGKPHIAEFACRFGGEIVYVNWRTSQVIGEDAHHRLAVRDPKGAGAFSRQVRNARVMVRGRVSHPDHKTILLRDWHFVHMNTENQSRAMRSVAFID